MADEKKALVATPVARDRAIERLQDHYAQSHLEVEDFERLVERAERARTDAELVALFEGLPSADLPAVVEQAPLAAGRMTASVRATLGSTSRRGRWRVPSLLRVRAILGAVDLDLCDAELGRGETVIELRAVLGSITVIVPEGLAVSCEGNAVLGSFAHVVLDAATKRDSRSVRILGTATLGSVDVVVKRKSGVLEEIKSAVRGLLG